MRTTKQHLKINLTHFENECDVTAYIILGRIETYVLVF